MKKVLMGQGLFITSIPLIMIIGGAEEFFKVSIINSFNGLLFIVSTLRLDVHIMEKKKATGKYSLNNAIIPLIISSVIILSLLSVFELLNETSFYGVNIYLLALSGISYTVTEIVNIFHSVEDDAKYIDNSKILQGLSLSLVILSALAELSKLSNLYALGMFLYMSLNIKLLIRASNYNLDVMGRIKINKLFKTYINRIRNNQVLILQTVLESAANFLIPSLLGLYTTANNAGKIMALIKISKIPSQITNQLYLNKIINQNLNYKDIKMLACLSLAISILFLLVGYIVFNSVGSKWEGLGSIFFYILPMMAAEAVYSPLSFIYQIEKDSKKIVFMFGVIYYLILIIPIFMIKDNELYGYICVVVILQSINLYYASSRIAKRFK